MQHIAIQPYKTMKLYSYQYLLKIRANTMELKLYRFISGKLMILMAL